jgi:hypothetical protein
MPMSESEDWTLGASDLLFQELQKSFAPTNGDVITIASGPNQELAEHSAMAAALTLIG